MTHARTAPLSQALARKQGSDDAHSFIELTYFNLLWIFVVASVVGLIGETIVATVMDGFVKDRAGLVWGPFSPLYGLGAVLMTVALNDLKGRSRILLFTVAAVVGGALEFVAGWFWKNAFGIIAWSYIDRPLNFGGYTCVEMMVVWGLAGLAWMLVALPIVMRVIGLIPANWRTPLTVAMSAFLLVDVTVTLMSFNFWFERLSGAVPETPLQLFFANHYGNEWMDDRFQTMSMWTDLAKR
ncbi:MAG: putative ABC transporter permease [Eggerthellaceae bacterium]|nr:putative ABC transporter permease [Eggerthellaceae bacterium]